jgi:ABC-type glycerol-3-phosphate transport system substrate-binding protein
VLFLTLLAPACRPAPAPSPHSAVPTATPQRVFLTPVTTPAPSERRLTLWLEPAFAPDSQTEAGRVLAERLSAFEAANPVARVDVRVKAHEGPAGLLATLTSASVAAPDVVPDLVLLDRPDLEVAAAQSLIVPLGNLLTQDNDPETLEPFVQASLVQGSYFGEPIGGDADLLAYRADIYQGPPMNWDDLASGPRPFTFAANDPAALFTLAQYLAAGGVVEDESGAALLQSEPLQAVLTFYQDLHDTGVLPLSSTQLTSTGESWAAVRDGRAASGAAPLSGVLAAEDNKRFGVAPLPGQQEPGLVLLHPWAWAIAAAEPEQQKAAADLVEWLLDPAFLGTWTEALGIVPATPDALQAWADVDDAATVTSLLSTARLMPGNSVLTRVAPALLQATLDVITGAQSPQDAAAQAEASLASP